MNLEQIKSELAEQLIESDGFKVDFEEPFIWASGAQMPVYNDNRVLLGNFKVRELISEGFSLLTEQHKLKPEVVVGVATGGIPYGLMLANKLQLPFAYVRPKAKDHGLTKVVEGLATVKNQRCLLVEDALSTGGSSLRALETIRNAGLIVDTVLSVFSYDFDICRENFKKTDAQCFSLIHATDVFEAALAQQKISSEEKSKLHDWLASAFETEN